MATLALSHEEDSADGYHDTDFQYPVVRPFHRGGGRARRVRGGGRSAGSTAARSPPELRDVRYCEEIADRTWTIAQLPDLASKLKLPSG